MRLAEKMGIDGVIGPWVIHKACEFCREMRGKNPQYSGLTVSICATARSLSSGAIVAAVKSALESTGLPSEALVVHFTERMIAMNYDKFMATLSTLKRIGVAVVIDNVGAYYSLASLLRHSAISAMTADITLFTGQIDDFDKRYIADLIQHAKANNVSVGVKSIENDEQLMLVTEADWFVNNY
jgi:EAL domain-containing protein (putative c-di-GMP-specific phosphodiesterase class I)